MIIFKTLAFEINTRKIKQFTKELDKLLNKYTTDKNSIYYKWDEIQ